MQWHLKSPASQLFTQENIKAQRHWPLWGIHWLPVNSPHKGQVIWKMFPFDDVIMVSIEVMGVCVEIIVLLWNLRGLQQHCYQDTCKFSKQLIHSKSIPCGFEASENWWQESFSLVNSGLGVRSSYLLHSYRATKHMMSIWRIWKES